MKRGEIAAIRRIVREENIHHSKKRDNFSWQKTYGWLTVVSTFGLVGSFIIRNEQPLGYLQIILLGMVILGVENWHVHDKIMKLME